MTDRLSPREMTIYSFLYKSDEQKSLDDVVQIYYDGYNIPKNPNNSVSRTIRTINKKLEGTNSPLIQRTTPIGRGYKSFYQVSRRSNEEILQSD